MIPEKTSSKEVESTVTGDVIDMSIDSAAMNHIMGLLTDLYSDPEMAVLREYSTNAWDAQREIGETRPIEVSLPGALTPFLLIRDFGVGLSVDDLHNIYSKYGASTKRATNDQVGMLGLGCKSALTYSDQFTVTSVRNGTRAQVVVSRTAAGGATMTVVETSATDDHSGTTITVPAKQRNDFERKARKFFRFWPTGSVLVNGEAPATLAPTLPITDDIFISSKVDQSYIVMGNVAYPWDEPGRHLTPGHHIVARVPIGSVAFTPNREALMYEDKVTLPTLERLEETISSCIAGAIMRHVDKAPTKHDALARLTYWRSALMGVLAGPHSYGGAAIPAVIRSSYARTAKQNSTGEVIVESGDKFIRVPRRCTRLTDHLICSELNSNEVPYALWFEGYDRASFTAAQKKKLNFFFNEKYGVNNETRFYMLVRGSLPPDSRQWIDPDKIIPWERVQAVKLPQRRSSGSSRLSGSYEYYDKVGRLHTNVSVDLLSERLSSYPMFYIQGSEDKAAAFYNVLANHLDMDDFSLVYLPANRVAKFERLFPRARNAAVVVQRLWKEWETKLTTAQRFAIAIQQNEERLFVRRLRNIDAGRVRDPSIAAAATSANYDLGHILETLARFRSVGAADTAAYKSPVTDIDMLLNPYPLLSWSMFDYMTDDEEAAVYEYINWKYDSTLTA